MRRLLWAGAALAVLLTAASAVAELAGRHVRLVPKADGPVALSAADPTGSANATGGYSLVATTLDSTAVGYKVTHVWCELESPGSVITGGTLRWWRQTTAADGGWAAAAGFDEVIGNVGEKRWAAKALKLVGIDTRVYCQPLSVTETAGDGGLIRTYVFRMEAP